MGAGRRGPPFVQDVQLAGSTSPSQGRRNDTGCWEGAERIETLREVSTCCSMPLLGGSLGSWEPGCMPQFPQLSVRGAKAQGRKCVGRGVGEVLGMAGEELSPS